MLRMTWKTLKITGKWLWATAEWRRRGEAPSPQRRTRSGEEEEMMESKEGELVGLVVFEMFTLEVSGLRVCLNIFNPTEILDFCKSKFASNFFSGSLPRCLTTFAFRQVTNLWILKQSGNSLRLQCFSCSAVFLSRSFLLGVQLRTEAFGGKVWETHFLREVVKIRSGSLEVIWQIKGTNTLPGFYLHLRIFSFTRMSRIV